MRCLSTWVLGCCVGLLAACGPTFNWRQTSIGDTGLVAMLPCKPEVLTRQVDLAEKLVDLTMRSCVTAGVTLAVGHAHLADPDSRPAVLARWREATLANMGADPASVSAQPPHRLQPLPHLVAVRASGKSPGGEPLTLQGLWFARGPEVFAALMLAPQASPDVAETFFSGLQFQ